jgi:hypothetical protein
MGVITLNEEKVAEIDQRIAVEGVDRWFAEQVSAGFDTGMGFTLGLAESDVALLTGNYVLAKEADALGSDIPPVIDVSGAPHSLNLEELTTVMLAYGSHRASLSQEYSTRKAAAIGG